MIHQLRPVNFKLIKRISPSQHYSMKRCPYKVVLAEAFDKMPLLPVSPAAYFGSVLHKVLELINKGKIVTNEDFDAKFIEEISLVEHALTGKGFDFFVPLKNNIKDFGVKKSLVRKHLPSSDRKVIQTGNNTVTSEKWLASNDGLIGGKLDLIVTSGLFVEIIDLKTGGIVENGVDDEGEVTVSIKLEYQEQLKLYAQLYFDNYHRYPDRITLVSLSDEKHSVTFNQAECQLIYNEAKELLVETNNSIVSKQFVAHPNEQNCCNCLYRPGCSFYNQHLDGSINKKDIGGIIRKVEKYRNGNVSIWLSVDSKTVLIKSLNPNLFTYLEAKKECYVKIYNLQKTGQEDVFNALKTTMIYE